MSTLSLRISLEGGRVTKTIQFHPNTTVFDACKIIRDKFADAVQGQPSEYGLFISDEQNQQGVWLEAGRTLGYYILHNQDTLEYRRKLRTLRVSMLDGAVKTILVDDSQPVSQLMVVICTKIGITNHEEYGLVREDTESQNENLPDNKFGTLTLRRKFTEKDRDAKMESLRKKLKTDDETNWVDVSRTLREQGIDESETVQLRRRFFFSDQNIDSRDPVQLNLLYVQARDAIVDGTHPVTQEKACEFAGIQVHIQFGPHNEAKHKPGFLDLKDFLPHSYVRVKNIEKKIFAEHKRHVELSEIDAKVLYTKTARELPTYGVTFFLVKEKMTGKNKLVPRLLGVTKDSVLRLDERTKEILVSWPLTTVRRWGASPNTFTLDFGDYADQYYSVQTTEAEQIVQLIAGYIDIILKKKQTKDHFGIEGDEGSTMVEESVAPSKATFLQHETNKVGKVNTESVAHPGVIRAYDGEKPYTQGELQTVQYGAFVGQVNYAHQPPTTKEVRISSVNLTEPQRALLGYISVGQDVLLRADEELRTKAPIQELGTDIRSIQWRENTLDTSKQAVTSHVATMSAATAQIVTASQPDEVDTEAISASVSQIAQTIPEVTKEVRLIAALMEDSNNGDKLLDAARNLCNAFSDLLRAAEPESKEPPQNLINAASRVGEATTHVLSTIAEEDAPENSQLNDMLLSLAKAVANTTAALVLRAKSICASCEDEETRNRVIGAASQCALATSQLVACAKVVAPSLHNSACREQLEMAARNVARAVTQLCDVCNEATNDPKLKNELLAAAREVSESLTDMLNHVKLSSREYATRTSEEMNPVENVIVGTDILVSSNDPQEMVRHAKSLGQATAQLIKSIKGEAEHQQDEDLQRRLYAAAQQLANATAKLVEAAQLCAVEPLAENQNALRRAAEELREITTVTAKTPAMKRHLIHRLEYCSKQAASAATQCITAAQNAVQHSDDHQTKECLLQDCKVAADTIPRLVATVKTTRSYPDDSNAQLNLIEAAEQFIEPAIQVSRSARALQPTVTDIPAATQLSRSALYLGQTISELNSAAQRAREACGGQELESALEAVRNLHNVLEDTRNAAQTDTIRPLPGETVENTAQQLRKSAKNVNVALSQLISSVIQGQRMYAGVAGRDTALALGEFTKSVHGVAATTNNPLVIERADDVVISSARLIEEAQRTLKNIGDTSALQQAGRDCQVALSKTVDCIPGQREVDTALRKVSELSEILSMSEFPPSNRSYNTLQGELKEVAEGLSYAGGQIVQSYASPAQLAETSQNFALKFRDFLSVSMELAGQTQDEIVRTSIIDCLRNVSSQSVSLLSTSKTIAADPGQPNSKNMLHAAARSVTESINQLVDASIQSAPGQKECDNAMRNIEALRVMLDYPHEPINEQGYFESVETATSKSRNLGYAISEMINNAKQSQHVEFGQSVNNVSESIHGLIESSAQAAYLIGVSHPSSAAGRPGIIDQAQLSWVYQGIRQHCDIVSNPNSTKQQKISALTVIAKHTSYLCSVCRQASMNTNNQVAKNEFIVLAKQVATATSNLVQEIKSIEDDQTTPSLLVEPLLDAVKAVRQYASNPEFVSVPAKISAEGRKAQEPVINAGRGVIDGVIEMVKAAKSLALSPDDPPVWQQLSMHSTPVSESVKRLVDNIRDKAPGQAQCDQVLHTLSTCTRELDSCALAVNAQGLSQRRDNNLHGFSGQTLNSAAELIDKLEPISMAGKNNAEQLGHAVGEVSRYIVPMVNGSIGACTHIVHSNQQMSLINQTKSVVESAIQLVQAAKESGGNPRATHAHPRLDDAIECIREAIQELQQTVEKINAETGIVTGLMEQVNRSITRLTDKRQSLLSASYSDTFVDYQTRMVQTAKEIARIANEMNAKSGIEPHKLPELAVDMTQQYTQMTQDSVGASMTTTSPDVAVRIRSTVIDLGRVVSSMIQSTAAGGSQNEIKRNARDVSDKVAQVLAALQAGSRGTQACINAAHTVSGIIGDLDTTIMFATAGTLHSDGEGTFADHREHILQTAKALVEDTKVLVTGAAGTQDQLAAAAQSAVATIQQLAEAVKRGACSLGSSQPDSQVMVINAVKDVASALGDLINATKSASGKPVHDPSMQDLKESARVMVLNVSSLLKTVKAVEDEHTRGTRAMEATVEAISQEIRAMHSPPLPGSVAVGPEDIIRVTKNVTIATGKAVAAGASNLQADIVSAANLGRRAISEMLLVCRLVAWNYAETDELRQRTLEAGAAVGESYRDLLNGILHNCSADERMHFSRRVAKCVTDLVAMARLLKGSDWIDPEDPTVIAENELLGAAASIDAAAKKLASLRPRRQADVKIELDENMKFDEMILEAAKGIMAASSALVRAANAAQRELIDQGKVARRPLHSSDDGQWSEGLISAARLVAAATHSLVEAAQNLVRGQGTEEMLIATAKQVAAATAQLLIACKVKSNPNSEAGRRLQAAGNAVIKSTDNLVRAAQQGLEAEEEHTLKINTSMVDGMAQEINARSVVLQMEKQLEEARQKLIHIRQARSRQKNTQGFTTDESDTEYAGGQHSAYGTLQHHNNSHSKSQNNSLNRSGIYNQMEMPTSPNYYYNSMPHGSGAGQHHQHQHHHHQQHFHIPSAVSPSPPPPPPPPAMNYTPYEASNGVHGGGAQHVSYPPPPPPPSSTTMSTFRSNPKLTANAVPRPYPGAAAGGSFNGKTATTTNLITNNSINNTKTLSSSSSLTTTTNNNTRVSGGSGGGGGSVTPTPMTMILTTTKSPKSTTTATTTPTNNQYQSSFETTSNQQHQQQQQQSTTTTFMPLKQQKQQNLAECVQDLHDKTFGQGGVVQLTLGNSGGAGNNIGNSQTGGQTYEGYTSRYETRNYDTATNSTKDAIKTPLESSFSQMTINTTDGVNAGGANNATTTTTTAATTSNDGVSKLGSLLEQVQGSERLSSMTQRVLERQTFTTTTESRSESKTESRSFRLEKQ